MRRETNAMSAGKGTAEETGVFRMGDARVSDYFDAPWSNLLPTNPMSSSLPCVLVLA